jgi:TonB-dependent starch-binding outer membrane protein SusC
MTFRITLAVLGAVGAMGLGAPRMAAAQATGTLRGRVIEASSKAGVGDAQITVVGTALAALSNTAGDYTINNVPAGPRTVRIRRLGFAPAERTITIDAGQTVRLDIELATSATQLSEMIVTGTAGAAERRTVGNSITKVDAAEVTGKTMALSAVDILQAKTPGLTILPGSGAPGTAGEIRIRGASSISGYKPVVFIDGVRYNIDDLGGFSATGGGTVGLAQSTQVLSALNNLNPNDIESIEVLKGPAASTLYGAEAANGVIQIITKKGTRGQQQLRWGVRAERGQSDWHYRPEDNYTTCDAAKQALKDALGNFVWPGCQGLPVNSIITGNPLMDDSRALRTGDLSRLETSLRGGGDRYSFYLSGSSDAEQGVFYNSDNNHRSVRSNFTMNPADKLDFAVNVAWQAGRIRLPMQDESANGLLLSSRRGLPGRASLLGVGNEGWRTISPDRANVYRNFTDTDRLTLGGTVNYNPFAWLRNRVTVGFDNTTTQAQILFLPSEIDVAQDPDAASGANLRRTPTRKIVTLDYAGSATWQATKSIGTTTSVGSQVVADRSERLDATGIGIGAPDVTLINLTTRTIGAETFTENNSVGYYAQEQLAWNDRLFLTGALRADDHSSFGTNFDFIIYPKLSLSYVLSEEPGAKRFLDAAHINSLKLRSAWGQAGRAPTAYSAPQTYTVDRATLGSTTGLAIRTNTFGNPDLKPERGEEIEVGFEAGLFSERLGVDFTYYDKKTTDMLQSVGIAPSLGFSGTTAQNTRLANLGEVSNTGVELSLFGTPVQRRNVAWETRFNLATFKNELLSFQVPRKTLETPTGQAYGAVQQHRIGFPMGGYWVTPPLRGPDGAALLTPAGAAQFPAGDTARRYIGPSSPTREIGFSNTVTLFKYFRVYALLDYKGGGYIFNLQERNRCQSNDNCWRVNNPRARFPQTAADTILFKELAVYRSASISPEWIQKSDFMKLREVSFTVDLPQRYLALMRVQSGTLILSGRNLALWTDYEGADPEVNSYGGRNFVRVDAYAAPMTRRFSAGINLTF